MVAEANELMASMHQQMNDIAQAAEGASDQSNRIRQSMEAQGEQLTQLAGTLSEKAGEVDGAVIRHGA